MRVTTPKSRRKSRPEIPVRELRKNVKDVLNAVEFRGERYIVTRNGDPSVAVVSLADLAKLEGAA